MNYLVKGEKGFLLNPEIGNQIAEFEKKAKEIKAAQDNLKEAILKEMEANGIIKLDTDQLSITYVAPTYKEGFDAIGFKKANEELYNQFIKISPVKASIRIKVK